MNDAKITYKKEEGLPERLPERLAVRKGIATDIIVLDEDETIRRIREDGCSIGRYGDGELRLAKYPQNNIPCHEGNEELGRRLREILRYKGKPAMEKTREFLVGVPNIRPGSKLYACKPRLHRVFLKPDLEDLYDREITYYSSLVTRNDMIERDLDYWKGFADIFTGKRVCVVGSDRKHLKDPMFAGAEKPLYFVQGTKQHSFRDYDRILKDCLRLRQEPNIIYALLLGPTATVLAFDLFKAGCQAIDTGNACRSYRRCRNQSR